VRLPSISLFLEPSPNIGIKPVEEYMRKTIVNATAKAGEIRTYAEEHGQQNLGLLIQSAFLWLPPHK
jgi:hypothetical protein